MLTASAASPKSRSRGWTASGDLVEDCRLAYGREIEMTVCKTGADHIKSLRDDRKVFIDGVAAADVTTHPAFRNAVHSAAALYDFQADPKNSELMTFPVDGSNRR